MIETVGFLFGLLAIYCAVIAFAAFFMTGKQAGAGIALMLSHGIGCLICWRLFVWLTGA